MTFRTTTLELAARAEFEVGDQVEFIQDNRLLVGVVADRGGEYIQVIVPINQAAARTPGADLSNTNCALYAVQACDAWRIVMSFEEP